MVPHLDTAMLLAEPRDRTGTPRGRVLFLVHRAADGWLGLDLTGQVVSRFAGPRSSPGAEIRIACGGPACQERIFALYALDLDPGSCGGLRVPGPGPLRFGFGGDVVELLRRAAAGNGAGGERLLLFRGLTALAVRSRSVPAGAEITRATPELVFETPREALWREVRRRTAVPALDRRCGAGRFSGGAA